MFVVTVNFIIDANVIDDFLVAMHSQAADSLRDEPDCHQFDVCTSTQKHNHIFLYEVYSSAEAFELHLQSEHFKRFDLRVKQWVVEKAVKTFNLKH